MKNNFKYQIKNNNKVTPIAFDKNDSDSLSSNLSLDTVDSDIQITKKDTNVIYGIKNINSIPSRKSLTTKSVAVEKPILYEPNVINRNIDSWQIILLLVLSILIAISKAFNQNRFNQILKSTFNYGTAQEIIREEKVFLHRANLWLTLVHLLSISLFIYYFIQSNLIISAQANLNTFIFISSSIIIAYLIKYISAKALFFIFNCSELSSEYVFNISIYNNLLGIMLIPILLIMYFTSIDVLTVSKYLIIPIFLLIYTLRLIRLFVAGNNNRISYFYIFLYICTLEILPLVVLYKVFIHK